jgi:hypothetical protein
MNCDDFGSGGTSSSVMKSCKRLLFSKRVKHHNVRSDFDIKTSSAVTTDGDIFIAFDLAVPIESFDAA